jgi:hypothetical protein
VSPEDAAKVVISHLAITREDIARAKSWLVRAPGTNVTGMADEWMREQKLTEIRQVNTDAEDCRDVLINVAKAYSVRLAYFQAIWELIAAGVVIPSSSPGRWQPSLEYRTSHYAGGIQLQSVGCSHPERIERLPYAVTEPADPDIFLQGVDCTTLHSGIVEAIEQALTCVRRGLYMPATAMLAAAAEATWTELGNAVEKVAADPKLTATMGDPHSGIARIVSDIRKVLEHKNSKPILQKAGLSIHNVTDAEVWMTTLRERRNALHWGKAKSFIADHAETGTLLMAAPQHLKTWKRSGLLANDGRTPMSLWYKPASEITFADIVAFCHP